MKIDSKLTALFFVALGILGSIGASQAQQRTTHGQYIEQYKGWAIVEQEIYGIPASITIAQGLLESDCGNSRLATEGNNHFGIKCKAEWTGLTIIHDDDEIGECFRKYPSAEQSYRDHSEFLDNSARYQSLFELEVDDYKGWARGLKAAGYATNPKYADMLIKLIEDHKLYLLDVEDGAAYADYMLGISKDKDEPVVITKGDEQVAVEKIDIDNYMVSVRTLSGYPVYTNNGSEFIVARSGDTYNRLSGIARVSQKKLYKFNDSTTSTQLHAGEQVYIRPKSNKAANGKVIHLVKSGETLHSISQMYGIKLKKLANINHLNIYSTINEGQQIRLM